MKWGLYGFLGLWLAAGMAWGAESETSTLPYLQQHAEDWPKQVALLQPVIFKVMLDGKAVGLATLPAGTEADLVSVAPEGLGLVTGTNQATVMPEQTDLWDRVKAIRDVRASFPDPSTSDPAASLQLPPNSAPADWYHQQLLEKLDPWLVKYPMSPLFSQMQARRAAFYDESVRVGNGEVRRGSLWYSPEAAAEKTLDFQAEDLLAQMGAVPGGAPAALDELVAQIPQYAKTEFHPALVRAALAAIDNLPAQDAATIRQALQAKQADLAAARDQSAAQLRAMLDHPYPSWETQPASPPPQGGIYFLDNYTHRYFLDSGNHPPGDGGIFGVYAHHYAGLLKYYPDDKSSMYPPLSTGDLAAALQLAAAVDKDEEQIAQLDRQAVGIDDTVARQKAVWAQRRETLAREPVADEEKVLHDLQGAAALDPVAALAVVQKAEEAWPGNEPADRIALDKAEEGLRQINQAIADGKIAEASEKGAAVRKLVAFPASTPRLERLKQESDDLAPQLAAAMALERAYTDRQYETISAAPAISPAFQPWQSALGRLVARQKADSHAAIEEIEPALLRCDPRGALASFHRAKALWPANPEVATAGRMLWIAAAAAGLVVLGFLMVIWERLATLVDHLAFKQKMKSKS